MFPLKSCLTKLGQNKNYILCIIYKFTCIHYRNVSLWTYFYSANDVLADCRKNSIDNVILLLAGQMRSENEK